MRYDIDLFDQNEMCAQLQPVIFSTSNSYIITVFFLRRFFFKGNTCSFTPCENGGLCQEDPTTIDCNFCICPVGFTGKRCETSVAILRMYHFCLAISDQLAILFIHLFSCWMQSWMSKRWCLQWEYLYMSDRLFRNIL